MSHEIRTPLNGVIGTTTLSARHVADDGAARVNLRRSAAAATCCCRSSTTSSISRRSKPARSRSTNAFDPHLAVEDTIELFSASAERRGDDEVVRRRRRRRGSASATDPHPPGAEQPGLERDQVHGARRSGRRSAHEGRRRRDRRAHLHRRRHRCGHPADHRPPVPAVRAGRCVDHAALRWLGPRVGDLAPAGRTHGRAPVGRERTRQGLAVLVSGCRSSASPTPRLHPMRARRSALAGACSSTTTPPTAWWSAVVRALGFEVTAGERQCCLAVSLVRAAVRRWRWCSTR